MMAFCAPRECEKNMSKMFESSLDDEICKFSPRVRLATINGGDSQTFFVPMRVIYDYEIIIILDGELVVQTEDMHYTLTKNDLHIMSPLILHKRMIEKGKYCTYYNLHFDFSNDSVDFSADEVYAKPCKEKIPNSPIIDELASRKIYRPNGFILPQKMRLSNAYEYFSICDKICENFKEKTLPARMRTIGYMKILLSMIFDSIIDESDSNEYADIIAQCQNFIVNHFNTEIDITKLALDLGFSPNHFRKIFKRITHKSPHDFQISYRLEQAQKLLKTGKYNVTNVSYMVGYDNPLYFSRAYKNKYGYAPSEEKL